MTGRQFIARVRRWAGARNLEVRFVASQGAGPHGTPYVGARKTTVKRPRAGPALRWRCAPGAPPAQGHTDRAWNKPRPVARLPDAFVPCEDRRKEIGKGLLAKMLADLGIDRKEFWPTGRQPVRRRGNHTMSPGRMTGLPEICRAPHPEPRASSFTDSRD